MDMDKDIIWPLNEMKSGEGGKYLGEGKNIAKGLHLNPNKYRLTDVLQ